MVRFNLDIAKKVLPYFIYKRIEVGNFREYFTFKIDYGFGYWLRAIKVKYPFLTQYYNNVIRSTVYASGGTEVPKLKLELFDNANFKARQPAAFTAELISSPNQGVCIAYQAPQPADPGVPYLINFTAEPAPKSLSNLNFLYRYGDIIRVDITGQELVQPSNIWGPPWLDILLVGYYVPQETFVMYGGNE
jgi:hypothetical protein